MPRPREMTAYEEHALFVSLVQELLRMQSWDLLQDE
jgi:hypothetical protein